ncbi:MAG TPA: response regulator transcription factor, partial [Sinomonas sp.]|nr:response regulator transcription factor [Sinomonas sp.]
MSTTVHVVDDHPVVRQGVAIVLEGDAELVLLGSSATSAEAVAAVKREPPAVVLLDVRLADADVVTTVGALLEACPSTRIVLFTADPDHPLVPAALRAGALAVVPKDVPPSVLRRVIRDAAGGRLRDRVPPASEPLLTARQQQVLENVARGMTNTEVAVLLG